jgi:membrane protease YdiL (CAAX protease family)
VPSRSRTAFALASFAAVAAPVFVPQLARGAPDAQLALWRTLSVQLCFAGLAGLIALRLGGSLRGRLGLVRGSPGAGPLALGVLGTLALSGALWFAVDALSLLPGTSLERLNAVAAAAASSPWLVLVAFGLAPGLAEELLCRGALQRSLAGPIGAWCVPLAALAFAGLHMDLVQSPAAFLLGCYLGALAWLRQTTWLAIACHLANNCAAALPQLSPTVGAVLPRPRTWGEAGVWLAVAGLSLAWVARASRPRESPNAGASG